ncbi:MAG: hypothetical protein Q8R98_08830 [Rubrivivax sp.]|nr:hypothetical protein [Rubrivivax sp.]MDP3222358.1 hypothetical protein [Rubrivivax sp.]MDP3611941.1 hypothetical protein [Rubrivivax sp.]
MAPQCAGRLACAPEAVDAVLDVFRRQGFETAAVVGEVAASQAAAADWLVR